MIENTLLVDDCESDINDEDIQMITVFKCYKNCKNNFVYL
jgi:hypothetical protein